jgi:hypothetical protein
MGNRRSKKRARTEAPDKPINESRLRQTLGHLTSRRRPVLQDLVPSGIVVEASTPEELLEKTEAMLVELTKKQPEN